VNQKEEVPVDNKESGLGFVGALTLLFIGLKLVHVIAWSWWWVLSPLWISTAVGVAVILVIVLAAVVSSLKGS
jgi:predicted tellurium resistance membrane protein TerC